MEQNKKYLYEYRDGKRVRNLGFMKIEESMNKSVLHIYASQIDDVVGIVFRRGSGEKYTAGWEDEPELQIEEYITPNNVIYEKIQRQGLSRLPRREWRIANNSFLLHGFYNYHHLLYMEEDGNVWIGVPASIMKRSRRRQVRLDSRSFGVLRITRFS